MNQPDDSGQAFGDYCTDCGMGFRHGHTRVSHNVDQCRYAVARKRELRNLQTEFERATERVVVFTDDQVKVSE